MLRKSVLFWNLLFLGIQVGIVFLFPQVGNSDIFSQRMSLGIILMLFNSFVMWELMEATSGERAKDNEMEDSLRLFSFVSFLGIIFLLFALVLLIKDELKGGEYQIGIVKWIRERIAKFNNYMDGVKPQQPSELLPVVVPVGERPLEFIPEEDADIVIYVSGWSGSGKTTIATLIEENLSSLGIQNVEYVNLDGDSNPQFADDKLQSIIDRGTKVKIMEKRRHFRL